MTIPNTIQIANGKQEAKLKRKKNSLSTNLYAIKLILQLKQKIGIDLPKVTSENTRAVCADVTQMY